MFGQIKNRRVAVSLFLIVSTFLLNVFYSNGQYRSLPQEALLKDLTYLEDSLPVKHINFYAHINKPQFHSYIEQIRLKCKSLDYEHFCLELTKLIAKVGDEHTFVEQEKLNDLPIKFQKFDEGYFVTAIESSYKGYLLTKLVSIGDTSINKIESSFKNIIPDINTSYFEVSVLKYLNNPYILHSMGYAATNGEFNYVLSVYDKKEIVALSNTPTDVIDYKKPERVYFPTSIGIPSYWYGIDRKNKIFYFNYSKCSNNEDLPFDTFNNQLWDSISFAHPEKIIIDLRDNSGGNSAILEVFEERLQNSYLNNKGKIYVLIGPKTFSSALMNAIELKKMTNCKLVGQPTSGNINHYGEVRGLNLPNSKIIIGYSTRYWENWKGKNGNLKPDKLIHYSIENYANGIDEAIQYVYKN